MNILAIDTSQQNYTMISSNDDQLIHWKNTEKAMIDAYHDACSSSPEHLIVCSGPGRYSGIRSGMAFAQGLAAGLQIPLYTISAFDILAFKSTLEGSCHIILDARKNQAYIQGYTNGIITQPMSIIAINEIHDQLNIGNIDHPFVTKENYNAQDMIAWFKQQTAPIDPDPSPSAIYLRPPTD